MNETVNHPKHYTSHPSGVECIAIVQHFNFNLGNAIKYLWRAGLKHGAPTLTDLEKAKKYIDFEIQRLIDTYPTPELDDDYKRPSSIGALAEKVFPRG